MIAGGLGLLVGCVHNGKGSPSVLSATNSPSQMTSNELAKARAMIESTMTEKERNEYENRLQGLPPLPSEFPFPNVEGYAHHPPPAYVNFYAIDDRYPTYLQCQYDVNEKNYNQSNEPKWFKVALKQIRNSGPTKFPPIKWVAVIIYNRGDYKDENTTFEQCTKAGAIFKASDVFDSSRDLSQLVADATMDRHPFKYDTSQTTPGEQQRWIIVEQHSATNLTARPQ